MEFKSLVNAIEYAPDKAMEFIVSVYSTLDSNGKAHFRAKFQQYFLDDGTLNNSNPDENKR